MVRREGTLYVPKKGTKFLTKLLPPHSAFKVLSWGFDLMVSFPAAALSFPPFSLEVPILYVLQMALKRCSLRFPRLFHFDASNEADHAFFF